MAIPKLESCPKCKGHLMQEKDNYGSYQQCLQCGYLRDLQIFPGITTEEMEDETESRTLHHVSPKGSRTISRDTGQITEYYRSTALADPLDFHLILDALHKRHRDDAQ